MKYTVHTIGFFVKTKIQIQIAIKRITNNTSNWPMVGVLIKLAYSQ